MTCNRFIQNINILALTCGIFYQESAICVICVCVRARMNVRKLIYSYIYIYIYIYIRPLLTCFLHAFVTVTMLVCVLVYVYMCVCVSVCARLCVYVCTVLYGKPNTYSTLFWATHGNEVRSNAKYLSNLFETSTLKSVYCPEMMFVSCMENTLARAPAWEHQY